MSVLSSLIKAYKRGTTDEKYLESDSSGRLYVRKGIPDLTQLVKDGKVWKAQDLTTAVVAVTMPTTTAGLTIQNPTDDLYYLVLAVPGIQDVSAAALHSWGLCHCPHQLAIAALTRDVALTSVKGMKCGQGAYNGSAILDRGATVADDLFSPIGDTYNSVIASQVWSQLYVPLHVPVIIPPGLHYSVGGVAHSATVEVGLGLVWAEITSAELD